MIFEGVQWIRLREHLQEFLVSIPQRKKLSSRFSLQSPDQVLSWLSALTCLTHGFHVFPIQQASLEELMG